MCFEISYPRTGVANYQNIDPRKNQNQLGQIKLPAPTGPFAIATKTYHWVDRSRIEKATGNPQDFRQLVVQVWYPTEDRSGPLAPYIPMLEAYRHIWDDADVELAGRVITHSRLNKKPHPGTKFPIVVFSHGWEGTRSEYTSIAEDLASRGYAVFGVDHPYMGRIVLPDGRVTEATEDQFQSPAEIRQYYGRDVQFAIDSIERLDSGDPDDTFGGRLELSRIAAIGHSSGFVAAGTTCTLDQRITACVNVDAPKFSAAQLAGLNQPLLWIRLERAGPPPAEFLKTARSSVYELCMPDAKHGSLEDWDYLEAESPLQREVAAKQLRLISKYLGAFLGVQLRGERSTLLEQNYSSPELTLTVYRPKKNGALP
jgi:pimeloyl-ACP methyl ester carboxylesterase